MQKALTILGQLTLGLVFIISSALKLFPVEPVELYVYSLGLTSWDLTAYLVRLLIGFEFFLGLLIISMQWRELVLKVTIGIVSTLTIFLLYNAIFTSTDNCFCFGEVLPMTPEQSIGKNILMLILALALLRTSISKVLPYQKLIVSLLFAVNISFPFIVNIPDSWMDTEFSQDGEEKMLYPIELMPENTRENLSKGKHIVCFFSVHCSVCQMAGQKLTIMDERIEEHLPISYFFYGEEEEVDDYWNESKSFKYPNQFLDSKTFFTLSGRSLPTVYLINDGVVKNIMGYREIMESTITDFMNE